MKNSENLKKYRNMKLTDLKSELKAQQKEHALYSLKVGAGKEDNFSKISKLSKNIARINTILLEKEYGAQNGK